jgi:vacuolar protein sorting-associated protein 72
MKAAEQRKEAAKPKAMTQADRLAEAARIERENSRSVRKWEEIEKRKEEERKAKIAASKNRKLEGPVISYWSGPALWVGDRRTHVGKGKITEEVLAESRRGKDDTAHTAITLDDPTPAVKGQPLATAVADSTSAQSAPRASSPHSTASEQAKSDFLDGIHYYASLPSQEQSTQSPAPSAPTADAPTTPIGSSTPCNDTQSGATLSEVLLQTGPAPISASTSVPPQSQSSPQQKLPPASQPLREVAACSLITLLNFNPEPKPKDRDAILRSLLSTSDRPYIPPVVGKWTNRLVPAVTPACAVTHRTARYRDPHTGLPYLDSYALKMIRRLAKGEFKWSEEFEVWLGQGIKPARGVPPGFEDPSKVPARRKEGAEGEKMDVSA